MRKARFLTYNLNMLNNLTQYLIILTYHIILILRNSFMFLWAEMGFHTIILSFLLQIKLKKIRHKSHKNEAIKDFINIIQTVPHIPSSRVSVWREEGRRGRTAASDVIGRVVST